MSGRADSRDQRPKRPKKIIGSRIGSEHQPKHFNPRDFGLSVITSRKALLERFTPSPVSAMSKRLVVSIPHHLGKDEALHLENGLAEVCR